MQYQAPTLIPCFWIFKPSPNLKIKSVDSWDSKMQKLT